MIDEKNTLEFIDSHCHFDDASLDINRDALYQASIQNGVNTQVVPGITAQSWDYLIKICSQYKGVYPALGVHPLFLHGHDQQSIAQLEHYIAQHKPVAIGEIGLDYYHEDADRGQQQWFLDAQLEVAKVHDLPIILHVRKAHEAMIKTIKHHGIDGVKVKAGIVHAFGGSLEQAKEYIKRGFYLGVGGTLTFEGSRRIRRIMAQVDIKHLVLETDSPHIPVCIGRARPSRPSDIAIIAAELAKLKNISIEQVAVQTTMNAKRLFDF